jgi:uncharacterized membrane protein YeaQ/YmgE (transglycosylase-associated protein family)
MNIIGFLIIGLIAGWLAGLLVKGEGYGFIGNILLGAIGGLIGGVVFDQLGFEFVGFLGSLLTALAGALILVFTVRLITKLLP